MFVTSMGIVEKRALIDAQKIDRTLHSLESVDYMKVDGCGGPSYYDGGYKA